MSKLRFRSPRTSLSKRELDEARAEEFANREEMKLEKRDLPAMILSAMLTIFLPSVLILGAMCLLLLWIGGAL